MKKLVFVFAAFAAISFASCGGNTTANNETADTVVVAEETVCSNDTTKCDSVCTTPCDSVKCDSTCKK